MGVCPFPCAIVLSWATRGGQGVDRSEGTTWAVRPRVPCPASLCSRGEKPRAHRVPRTWLASACSAQPLPALLRGSLLYWVPGFYPLPQTQLPSGQCKWVEILTKLSSVLGRQASGASCRCPEVPNPPPTGYTTWSKLSCLSLHFLTSQVQIILLRLNWWRFDTDVVLKTAWSKPPSPLRLPRPAPALRLPGPPKADPLPLLAVASAPSLGTRSWGLGGRGASPSSIPISGGGHRECLVWGAGF